MAISPDTPSTAITDEVGEAADMLLVMTVYPGSSKFTLRCIGGAGEGNVSVVLPWWDVHNSATALDSQSFWAPTEGIPCM